MTAGGLWDGFLTMAGIEISHRIVDGNPTASRISLAHIVIDVVAPHVVVVVVDLVFFRFGQLDQITNFATRSAKLIDVTGLPAISALRDSFGRQAPFHAQQIVAEGAAGSMIVVDEQMERRPGEKRGATAAQMAGRLVGDQGVIGSADATDELLEGVESRFLGRGGDARLNDDFLDTQIVFDIFNQAWREKSGARGATDNGEVKLLDKKLLGYIDSPCDKETQFNRNNTELGQPRNTVDILIPLGPHIIESFEDDARVRLMIRSLDRKHDLAEDLQLVRGFRLRIHVLETKSQNFLQREDVVLFTLSDRRCCTSSQRAIKKNNRILSSYLHSRIGKGV